MIETLEETQARIRKTMSGPGETSQWILAHLDYENERECLIWPFVIDGESYPKHSYPRGVPVHRIMCEYRHGAPPSPRHQSAHSCDRGLQGCVNRMHVSWKTPSGNQFDRYNGKPVQPRHKLTAEIADQIRQLQGKERPIDIATRFNVTVRNVRLIFAGTAWKPGSNPRIFTSEEVMAIRGLRGHISAVKVAEQYRASRNQIERIMTSKTYRWVSD